MPFSFDEDFALRLNAVAAGAAAFGHIVTPRDTSNMLYTSLSPVNRPAMIHAGIPGGFAAATCGILTNSTDGRTKRNVLKVIGVAQLAHAGTHLWAVRNKTEKRDAGVGAAAASAAMAAVSLAVGYRK